VTQCDLSCKIFFSFSFVFHCIFSVSVSCQFFVIFSFPFSFPLINGIKIFPLTDISVSVNVNHTVFRDSVQTHTMWVKPGLDRLPKKIKNPVTKFKHFSRTFNYRTIIILRTFKGLAFDCVKFKHFSRLSGTSGNPDRTATFCLEKFCMFCCQIAIHFLDVHSTYFILSTPSKPISKWA